MKKTWIYGIVIATILLVVIGVYLRTQNSSSTKIKSSGPNVFNGRIISGNVDAQTYADVSVLTDEGCTTDPRNGLANCTTKLQTKNDVISFNYEHDMMEKPCLSLGDKATMQVFANGTALVDRTYWSGGGGV